MKRTSSNGSTDSGYATRAPSVASSTLHQSYPIQSHDYAPSRHPSQQSSSYSYSNQVSPEIEVIRAAPEYSSKQKKMRRLRYDTTLIAVTFDAKRCPSIPIYGQPPQSLYSLTSYSAPHLHHPLPNTPACTPAAATLAPKLTISNVIWQYTFPLHQNSCWIVNTNGAGALTLTDSRGKTIVRSTIGRYI